MPSDYFSEEMDKKGNSQGTSVPVGTSTRCQCCQLREDKKSRTKLFQCGKAVCNIHRREVKTFFRFDYQDGIEQNSGVEKWVEISEI